MTSAWTEQELSEWDDLIRSVPERIKGIGETCPNAVSKIKSYPDMYSTFMLPALSRSYIMARWMMLAEAKKSHDLDLLRVYDRFIADPAVDHRAITPTVMALRRAGHAQAARVVTTEHLSRYATLNKQATGDLLGSMRWSETNMEMLYAAFITGSDANRSFISVSVESALDMMRERNITTLEELLHFLNGAGDGSAVLRHGAL